MKRFHGILRMILSGTGPALFGTAHHLNFAPKFRFGSNPSVARPSGSAALPALRAQELPAAGLCLQLARSSTSTSPRSSTVVGQPFTVRPFHGV